MKRSADFGIVVFGAVLVTALASAPVRAQICVTSDGNENTGCGTNTLTVNTGHTNTAIGYGALYRNTTATGNTATGDAALTENTTGSNNTATGALALLNNTTGSMNTATGIGALSANSTGYANTAIGAEALQLNTTGVANTASGYAALDVNTTGSYNTADGLGALGHTKLGSENTASGFQALDANTSGSDNTASGYAALSNSTTADGDTAIGYQALLDDSTGFNNTAVGTNAGANIATGAGDTFIGYGTRANRPNYRNGTVIGQYALLTASNSIVLGDAKITAIYSEVTSITALSDRRRKKDIAPLKKELGLAFIAKLRPVSYRFRNGDETERYGFIAQDLEKALPAKLQDKIENAKPEHGVALISRQNDAARTYRVAYGELTAPLVEAIQEQQEQISAQQREIADLRAALAALQKRVGIMTMAQAASPKH